MAGTQHMGHDMGAMKHDMRGMQHDMKGMAPATAVTRPGEGAAPSAPRITPTTFPATTQAAIYTCPMHPDVLADKPGKCPKCGMKLMPKQDGQAPGRQGGDE
jgi:hypothetical protein